MTSTSFIRTRGRVSAVLLAAAAVAAAACSDTPFQVIEETQFDPSLGVDLDSMELLPSGVYIQDIVIGPGNTVLTNSEVAVTYDGYVSDGSRFGEGQFNFVLGTASVIPGFELGVLGMNQGGERKIVIPPSLGYAEEEQTGIPAGSILIFDVIVDSIFGVEPPN
jgi:FKBP-type peptidyl-prolyl cis-trans isomerase